MVRKRAPCILAYAGLAGVGDEVGVVGRENGIASVGAVNISGYVQADCKMRE